MHIYSKCYEFATNELEVTKYEINMVKLNNGFVIQTIISFSNPFVYEKEFHKTKVSTVKYTDKLNACNFLRNKLIGVKKKLLEHIRYIDLFVSPNHIELYCDTNPTDYNALRVNYKNKMINSLERIERIDINEYPLEMWA
jgi:hypothetical protein